MNDQFVAAMRQAAQSLRAQKVVEATRLIQSALTRKLSDAPSSEAPSPAPIPTLRPRKSDGEYGKAASSPSVAMRQTEDGASANLHPGIGRVRKPLGEALEALRKGRLKLRPIGPRPIGRPLGPPLPVVPDGAKFLRRSYACAAGVREYKLYIPASAKDRPSGLVVMLHGCNQNPDDFAVGTNMNAVGEAHHLLVVYPAQSGSANTMSCWNWFNPADQKRDRGEPSIIAGITRELVREFGIGGRRVFVAGLSAGGAMAAVMGETYPDLYAAIAVHSGIACRSANDVVSAFEAMRGKPISAAPAKSHVRGLESKVRTIVFHGSADVTVVPSNADRIVADVTRQFPPLQIRRAEGSVNGRRFKRTSALALNDVPMVECWIIEGAGHAWSGGRPEGSYTDFQGPDASAEMVRFFLADE